MRSPPHVTDGWNSVLGQATLRGRPPLEQPKRSATVRYDVEVIDAFKATGKGWQTRMNQALKEWLSSHPSY